MRDSRNLQVRGCFVLTRFSEHSSNFFDCESKTLAKQKQCHGFLDKISPIKCYRTSSKNWYLNPKIKWARHATSSECFRTMSPGLRRLGSPRSHSSTTVPGGMAIPGKCPPKAVDKDIKIFGQTSPSTTTCPPSAREQRAPPLCEGVCLCKYSTLSL